MYCKTGFCLQQFIQHCTKALLINSAMFYMIAICYHDTGGLAYSVPYLKSKHSSLMSQWIHTNCMSCSGLKRKDTKVYSSAQPKLIITCYFLSCQTWQANIYPDHFSGTVRRKMIMNSLGSPWLQNWFLTGIQHVVWALLRWQYGNSLAEHKYIFHASWTHCVISQWAHWKKRKLLNLVTHKTPTNNNHHHHHQMFPVVAFETISGISWLNMLLQLMSHHVNWVMFKLKSPNIFFFYNQCVLEKKSFTV